jgi:putative transposase
MTITAVDYHTGVARCQTPVLVSKRQQQDSYKRSTCATLPSDHGYVRVMARARREFTAGGTYHVFSRGSNRRAIFRFDSDRTDFLECLERVVVRHELDCLAYCLMPNHFHLVLRTPDGRLSDAMKALNGRYSLRFNKRHGCDAHLFKNRFGAVAQKTESQLLWTLRYVVWNPVRSGLCGDPAEWPWSSYCASIGEVVPPQFLARRRLLSYFGDVPEVAMARYRDLVHPPHADFGV